MLNNSTFMENLDKLRHCTKQEFALDAMEFAKELLVQYEEQNALINKLNISLKNVSQGITQAKLIILNDERLDFEVKKNDIIAVLDACLTDIKE